MSPYQIENDKFRESYESLQVEIASLIVRYSFL